MQRRELDRFLKAAAGIKGYKTFLKTSTYRQKVMQALNCHPNCRVCGAVATATFYSKWTPENLLGDSLDGLESLCLICEHKILFNDKGAFRTIGQQLAAFDAMKPAATPASKSEYSSAKISGEQRDKLLAENGFQGLISYMASPGFAGKRKHLFKRCNGKCDCCGQPACIVHFRWYSELNLLTPNLHGMAAICSNCHKKTAISGRSAHCFWHETTRQEVPRATSKTT